MRMYVQHRLIQVVAVLTCIISIYRLHDFYIFRRTYFELNYKDLCRVFLWCFSLFLNIKRTTKRWLSRLVRNQHCGLCVKYRTGSAYAYRACLPGYTLFASCGFSVSGIITLYLYPLRRNVSARISLRGLRRLIWVDTLRGGHNVGFLAGLLNFNYSYWSFTPSSPIIPKATMMFIVTKIPIDMELGNGERFISLTESFFSCNMTRSTSPNKCYYVAEYWFDR